jgi:uncharacterized protein YjiS (DUF1127 family)
MQFVLLIPRIGAVSASREKEIREEAAMSNRLLTTEIVRLLPQEWLAVRGRPPRAASSWDGMRAAWRRYRSRQNIAQLDSHMLKDIGVSFAEAEAEANKPFWRS